MSYQKNLILIHITFSFIFREQKRNEVEKRGNYKSEKNLTNSVSPSVLGNKFSINIFSDMIL
jgi:hypothetical protein